VLLKSVGVVVVKGLLGQPGFAYEVLATSR
jgi:hypothetical protein